MRRRAVWVMGVAAPVLVWAIPAQGSAQQSATAARSLVFDGVTVVDVEHGQLVPAQRVVIAGNRIQAVGAPGAVPTPKGAQVVAARGKYLIPGLWDMHVHTGPDKGGDGYSALDHYAAFLTAGVTGVRDMNLNKTTSPILQQWRHQVAAGTRVGPRVLGGGRPRDAEMPETAAQGRQAIDSLKALGVDFVKAHTWGKVSRDAYFAMAAEARRVGLVFTGHLPHNVTMAEASDSGARSLEHFGYFSGPCWQPDSAGEAQCRELAARFVRNGTWLTPTLANRGDTILHHTAEWYEHYVPDTVRIENILHVNDHIGDRTDGLWFVHRAQRFGGFPWLAGTDVSLGSGLGSPDVGEIHLELALFVEAGLTPVEALRTATLNVAQYLQTTDSLGTVAPGKLADLVLLDADPLANIANTRTIRAVVANGRYFDRAAFKLIKANNRYAKSP